MGFPYYFLFLWNTFNDINVLKRLVCEIVESLAPKGVMELVYSIKTIIVNCWSWVRVSFHFYIPKFLKVPVDKRSNTFQHLHGVISTYHRDSSWPPQFGFIRWTRKPGPPEALKNSPRHAPTDVQEGFPWTVFRNALLLVLKKQKQHALQVMERVVQFSPCSDSRLQKGQTVTCSVNAGLGARPLACHAL